MSQKKLVIFQVNFSKLAFSALAPVPVWYHRPEIPPFAFSIELFPTRVLFLSLEIVPFLRIPSTFSFFTQNIKI